MKKRKFISIAIFIIATSLLVFEIVRFLNRDETYYINKGLAYFKKGETYRAIDEFTKAIEINKNSVLAYTYRGDAYQSLIGIDNGYKELYLAYLDYRKAYLLNRTNKKLLREMIKVFSLYIDSHYLSCGAAPFHICKYSKFIEVLRLLQNCIDIAPDCEMLYELRAMLLYYNWYDFATEDLETAIKLAPNRIDNYMMLAEIDPNPEIDRIAAAIKSAIQSLRKALKIDSSYYREWCRLAYLYALSGEKKKSETALKNAYLFASKENKEEAKKEIENMRKKIANLHK